MHISRRVVRRDPLTHVLVDGRVVVGWMRSGVLGFCGFADLVQASEAMRVAATVLAGSRLTIDDGCVARARSPRLVPIAGVETHGFELMVPITACATETHRAWQRIHAAIVRPRRDDAPAALLAQETRRGLGGERP